MKLSAIVLSLFILSLNTIVEEKPWKKEQTKDKAFTVSYRVLEKKDKSGEEVQVLEYLVETMARVSMQKCISLMKNDAKHTDFMDDAESSTNVKKISENEWITYYYFDPTWPMPNSDCVTKFKISEDAANKTVVINAQAVPNSYADQGVKRIQYNDIKYIFKELENGNIKISMRVSVTPVISAPEWLISSWFPEGAAGTLRSLIALANKQQ